MSSDNDNTDLTPEQERELSEGVQLQFAARAMFMKLIELELTPQIGLGALAAVAGEVLFRTSNKQQQRMANRMAFDQAVRNTIAALEAVESEGVMAATRGLAQIQNQMERADAAQNNAQNNVVSLTPKGK